MSQVKSFATAFSRMWHTDWKPEDAGVMARRNGVIYCFLNTLLMGVVVWKGITLVGGLLAVAVACCQWGVMLVRSKNRLPALSGLHLLVFTDLILVCVARYPFFLTGVGTQPPWSDGSDPLIWLWALPAVGLLVWGMGSIKRRWPLLAGGLLWCWTCIVGMGSTDGFEGLGSMGRSLLLITMSAMVIWYGVSHVACTVLPQQKSVGCWLWVPILVALPLFLTFFPTQASWIALSLPRLLDALTPGWIWLFVAAMLALLSVPMRMAPNTMGVDALGLWCLAGGMVLVFGLHRMYFSWCWLLLGVYAFLCFLIFRQEMKKQGALGIYNGDVVLLLTVAGLLLSALLSQDLWPLAVTAAVYLLALWTQKKRQGRLWILALAMGMTLMMVLSWYIHRSPMTLLLIALTFLFTGAAFWLLDRPMPGGIQLSRWAAPAGVCGALLLSLVLVTRAGVAISVSWEGDQLLLTLTPRAADGQIVEIEAYWDGQPLSLIPGENTLIPAGEQLTVKAVDEKGVESRRTLYYPYTLKTLTQSLETMEQNARQSLQAWQDEVRLNALLLHDAGEAPPDAWGEGNALCLAHPMMAGAADYRLEMEGSPFVTTSFENGVLTITPEGISNHKAYESTLTLLDSGGEELDQFHFWLLVGFPGEALPLPLDPPTQEPVRLVSSSSARLAQDGGALYLGPAGSSWQLSALDDGYALQDFGWSDLYLTTADGALSMIEEPVSWRFDCQWVMGQGRYWQLSRNGLVLMSDGESVWLEEDPENGLCWTLTRLSEEG